MRTADIGLLDARRESSPRSLRRHGRPAAADTSRVARLRDAHPPRSIPASAVALIGDGVTVITATRDAVMRPQIARAWGPEVQGQRGPLRLCVEAPDGSATARNLVERSEIAVTFTRPTTYQSVQLKGLTIEVRAPTEQELGLVDEHQVALSMEIHKVGIPLRLGPRFLDRASLVSVAIAVDELYDQTPGRAAGMSL